MIKPISQLAVDPHKKSYTENKSDTSKIEKNNISDGSAVEDLTNAEVAFYAAIGAFESHRNVEYACVGLGSGDGFTNTDELHTMKYKEAIATDEADEWQDTVEKEHNRMKKNTVFKAVPVEEVPKDAKTLTSTWSMKKKPNGTKRARLVDMSKPMVSIINPMKLLHL